MRSAMAIAIMLTLGACNVVEARRGEAVQAQGSGGERVFSVGNFDSVSLAGHQNVLVTVGGVPSVGAEGDPRELEDLEIRIDGNDLRIGLKRGAEQRERSAVTVHVNVPALANAAIGGSGDMRIDRIAGPRFAAAIGGSGNIDIAALRVDNASFSIAGSGNIRVGSGEAKESEISIAGSGNADLAAVQNATIDVSVVGSGDVHARASESASVTVLGSGDVNISGTDRCDVTRMGSGDIRCAA